MKPTRVEISKNTILFILFLAAGLYFVFRVRDILILLFLAFIFASALNSTVTRMERRRVPRAISVLGIYLVFFSAIAVAISIVVPPLVHQTTVLLSQVHLPVLPIPIDLAQLQDDMQNYQTLLSKIGGSIPGILNAVLTTFSSVLVTFTILVMTFYLTLEKNHLYKHIVWMFGGSEPEKKAEKFVASLEKQLGGWVRGEVTLMLIIGTAIYIGLSLLGIPFALPLALLAGTLEVVPNIGPTISAFPAIGIAFFMVSPTMGVITMFLYILVQQLENNLIVPKVMSNAVGIHPLVTIFVLLSGFRLDGVIGAVLAVPVFITLRTILNLYLDGKSPLGSHGDSLA